MDIERLNRIREICFNSKGSKNKTLSRSPLTRVNDKENINITQLKSKKNPSKIDPLKNFEQ